MEAIKQINGQLIGRDSKGHIFRLDGNGVWQQLNELDLFKLM